MIHTRVPITLAVAAAAFVCSSAPAWASAPVPDRIYRSDGSILEDVEVQSETLSTVTYKPAKGRDEEQIDSELVLRIDFSKKPDEVAEADFEAESENYASAISGMENYIANLGDKNDRKAPWAKAYARYRIVEFSRLMGDIEGMVAAVDALLANAPEARYVPLAMVQKIEAQLASGDQAGAAASAKTFGDLVRDKSLSQRWRYEQELRSLLSDASKKGEDLEKELAKLSKSAAAFPTVENRADVAIAESMVLRSEFEQAEELFRAVTEDPNAFNSTLAAAWTGLGDSLYRRAQAKLGAGDQEAATGLLKEARVAFMRVVVNFKNEYAYVAKSAFYAGRCIQELGGPEAKDRSNRLFYFVIRNFTGSRWADDAKVYQRQNR